MSDKVTKAELTSTLADKTGLTKKQAGEVLDALTDAVQDAAVAGKSVAILGGTLTPKTQAARTGVVPGTTEKRDYPAKQTVKFKPGTALEAALNP